MSNQIDNNRQEEIKNTRKSFELDPIKEDKFESEQTSGLEEIYDLDGFSETTSELEQKPLYKTVYEVFISSAPISISLLFIYLIETINIMCIGSFNDPELLTAIGLGTFFTNVIGIIAIFGWPGGMDTLCSKAYGAKQHLLVGIYTSICRLVIVAYIIIVVIPLSLVSYKFYILLGQSHSVSLLAHKFNLLMIPALFFLGLLTILSRYLQSIKIFEVGMYTSFISFILHPIWAWFFIYKLELKVEGAAISLGITQFINWILTLAYCKFSTRINKESNLYFYKETFSLTYIKRYLEVAVPAFILLLVESFSFEIMILISSFLGPVEMAANICLYNFSTIGYMISTGIGFAGGTLVGNAVGKKSVSIAKKYVKSILIYTFCFVIFYSILINIYKYQIIAAYTTNPEITNCIDLVWNFYAYNLLFEYPGTVIGGINKGLGRQAQTVKVWLLIQYFFGIPLILILTFYFNLRIEGVWIGQMINIIFICFGSTFVYFSKPLEEIIDEFILELEIYNKRKSSYDFLLKDDKIDKELTMKLI